MFDFSNLEIKGRHAKYELVELGENPKPKLILKPAGQENKGFFNAYLAEFGGNQNRVRRSVQVTAENAEKNHEVLRRLYPEHVCIGWEGMRDTDGNLVPFSKAACAEFFAKIPGWILDGIIGFANDPANFVETPAVDIEELSGNSNPASDGKSDTAGTAGL